MDLRWQRWWRHARAAAALASLALLAGCGNLGYYWQSASGHIHLMAAARPLPDWLQDPATPPRLKERLALARRIRAYASRRLGLPDNASYTRYADLHRSAAVWNVVAAPRYSLTLKPYCFPVTGCVGYRGFFDEAQARAQAAELTREGYEASVYPVPAYSTLGWMNWAGGDPLLNTFILYPEGELARLVFHELAHQVVYARDDTMFNESFATAVERLGGALWLKEEGGAQAREAYAQYDGRRQQFRALTAATRARLQAVYEQAPADQREAQKQQVLRDFRGQWQQLRASWPGDPARYQAYDRWVAEANNAAFGAQAAYDELVPGFEALFHLNGDDWGRFYDAVKALAALPRALRHQRLKEMARA
ncbi:MULTISPECIES: aminopeptidase [Ramlibacter]|uniref:Aminopeptidase n=1 Tax=Ramlibacter aquaticus TaxID=2780094 RepID=A0ABR9SJ85_9BURK|nr:MULTISPECIES: aminopeptidase [Ramlibacter]MBE7942429.1 aminopeptidase [Ramlibacter aquaticus]